MSSDQKPLEYPRLNFSDEIDERVSSVLVERSFARVRFESGLSRTIYFAINDYYQPRDLPFFVRVGDTFQKKVDNDSVIIIRNDKAFVFVLDKQIKCCK